MQKEKEINPKVGKKYDNALNLVACKEINAYLVGRILISSGHIS
jgi:hypothetical protein